MDTNEKLKLDLDNRIWVTKKARMECAARLKNKHEFYNGLVTYYSCIVIILSLIKFNSADTYNTWIFGVSILVTVFSVHSNTKNYLERHISMKSNYVAISKLEDKLKCLHSNDEDFQIKFNEIINEYSELMHNCENHHSFDYFKVYVLSNANEKFSTDITRRERYKSFKRKYYIRQFWEYIKFATWVVIPIIIVIIAVISFNGGIENEIETSVIQENNIESAVIE